MYKIRTCKNCRYRYRNGDKKPCCKCNNCYECFSMDIKWKERLFIQCIIDKIKERIKKWQWRKLI